MNKKNIVEVSIQQFCDNAKVRLEKCHDFDSKRQFLLDHVEKIVYGKNKIRIHGAVPLRVSDRNQDDTAESNKIAFIIEDTFDKRLFRKKTRAHYLVDSRLKEWGSAGRDANVYSERLKELHSEKVKASQVTQQVWNTPTRAAIGYTVNGRKKIKELGTQGRNVFLSAITER